MSHFNSPRSSLVTCQSCQHHRLYILIRSGDPFGDPLAPLRTVSAVEVDADPSTTTKPSHKRAEGVKLVLKDLQTELLHALPSIYPKTLVSASNPRSRNRSPPANAPQQASRLSDNTARHRTSDSNWIKAMDGPNRQRTSLAKDCKYSPFRA